MSDSALCSENMKVNETHSSCSRRTYINFVLTSSISSNLLQSYFSMLESLTQLAPKTVPESIFLVDFHIFSGLRFHGLSHRMKSCQTATYDWSSYVELTNVYPGYQRTKRLNNDLMEVKKFSLSFPSQSEWIHTHDQIMSLAPCVRNDAKSSRRLPGLTHCISVFSLVVPLYPLGSCLLFGGTTKNDLHVSVDVGKTHTCSTSLKPKTGRIRGFWLLIMVLSSIESWLPGPGTAFN